MAVIKVESREIPPEIQKKISESLEIGREAKRKRLISGGAFDPSILRVGDLMCYRPKGFIGWMIASRTFSNWAHVEVYAGDGISWASRDLRGVSAAPMRLTELGRVMRPKSPLDWHSAAVWFKTVDKQAYDLWAIARFLLPHAIKRDVDLTRQICSSLVVRLYRAAKFDPVAADADADLIAPSNLAQSAAFDVIWSDGKP